MNSFCVRALALGLLITCSGVVADAASYMIWDTSIATVAVNGGADTASAGTTCVQISSPISEACTSGFVAVPNNNKELIAAALLLKATMNKVNFYYADGQPLYHCPGLVMTPCSVISIMGR